MRTAIFTKTCKKDLPWLRFCLESIYLYCRGFEKLVIVGDEDCREPLSQMSTLGAELHFVEPWPHGNGYLQQQVVKLNADLYCGTEAILFVDSDNVFFSPVTPDTYIIGQKPVVKMQKYAVVGDRQIWRRITQEFTGIPVEYEYMWQHPMIYLSSTLELVRSLYPDLQKKIHDIPHLHGPHLVVSEFNIMGAVAHHHQADKYHMLDIDLPENHWAREAKCKGFWSWGGITPEILEEIGHLLGTAS